LEYREGGVDIVPAGTRHATITPYGPFLAADDTVINIAVQNDRQWKLLCEVLELEELRRDRRLATNSGRLEHRSRVEDAVKAAISTWPSGELEAALDRQGIPWGRLNKTADVAQHPQLESRRRWKTVGLPDGRSVSVLES